MNFRGETDPCERKEKRTVLAILETCMHDLLAAGRSRAELTATFHFFTRYLGDNHVSWERFGLKEAQGVQTALMAMQDGSGKRLYAPATVVKMIGTLKIFYGWAKKRHLVHENPFRRVKCVKQPKKLPKDIYGPAEMESLLAWLGDFSAGSTVKDKRERYLAHLVAELMYATGLTVGEVKRLRPGDLDLERRTARVFLPQYKRERVCFLSEYAAGILGIYVEELRPLILVSPNYRNSRHLLFGTSAELTRTVNRVLLAASAVLELSPCTTRMFRHALSLHLVKAGCDARFAQELVGHESLSTTQLYVRIDTRDLRGALDEFHPRAALKTL